MALQFDDLLVQDGREGFVVQRVIGDDGVDAVDELGGELLAHGTQRDALQLAVEFGSFVTHTGLEAEVGIDLLDHLAGAQVAGEEDQAAIEVHRGVVAQAENGPVENAHQQARHGRRGLVDFVEQHQREVALLAGDRVELLLGEHGLSFAVAEIAGRGADELGHLVLHLVLAAIDLEDVLLAAVQDLGQRLNGLGLAGTGGTQQEENPYRPALGSKARLEHLDVGDDVLHGGRLPNDLLR